MQMLLLAALLQADRLKITIDDPSFKPIAIAVAELGDKTLTDTLRSDLDFSYVFTSVNPKSFLAPSNEDFAAPQFPAWTSVGAAGLVKGQVTSSSIAFKFYDVASQRELLSKTYPRGDSRTAAHEFADELVALYTGQRGVFSTQIAFAARGANNATGIYVMDFDGSNLRKLPIAPKLNLLPAWGGSEVFYTSYANNNPDLYAFNLATQKARPVSTSHGLNSGAAVFGKRVALTLSKDGNPEVYTMGLDGSDPKRLTDNWWIDTSPSWSPDGKQIAYVSGKSGKPHIYVMNADGSGSHRVTQQGNYNQTPDWSPRGNLIAFTARDERFRFDIFTVDPATSEIKRLTQDEGNNEEPSFSPDGRLIAFISDRSGKRKVWVMNADGTRPRQVYSGGEECETPSWSPRLR